SGSCGLNAGYGNAIPRAGGATAKLLNQALTDGAQAPDTSPPTAGKTDRIEPGHMSSILTASTRRMRDHFEPQDTDPQVQRRLRGTLERTDYAAFVSNREVIASALTRVDQQTFQRLAVAAATARARWAAEAIRLSESGSPATPDQIARLTAHRTAFEELAEAYEG